MVFPIILFSYNIQKKLAFNFMFDILRYKNAKCRKKKSNVIIYVVYFHMVLSLLSINFFLKVKSQTFSILFLGPEQWHAPKKPQPSASAQRQPITGPPDQPLNNHPLPEPGQVQPGRPGPGHTDAGLHVRAVLVCHRGRESAQTDLSAAHERKDVPGVLAGFPVFEGRFGEFAVRGSGAG